MASDNIVTVTDESFDAEVLKSETPVLIDFWAEWCGPCRMVAPVLEQLATKYAGKLRIAKLNIDEHQAVASKYMINSIPAFILFKGGEVADRMIGAMPASAFESFVQRNL
jgi:thioredoxin